MDELKEKDVVQAIDPVWLGSVLIGDIGIIDTVFCPDYFEVLFRSRVDGTEFYTDAITEVIKPVERTEVNRILFRNNSELSVQVMVEGEEAFSSTIKSMGVEEVCGPLMIRGLIPVQVRNAVTGKILQTHTYFVSDTSVKSVDCELILRYPPTFERTD